MMDSNTVGRCTVQTRERPHDVEDISQALDNVAVHGPGCWENDASHALGDWWAVSTADLGIVAYFMDEADACSYRLRLIDRWFNG
jgi:hypothetical protein